MMFRHLGPVAHPALVNGAPGVVVAPDGKPFAVMGFTVAGGRVVEIYVLNGPARLGRDWTSRSWTDGGGHRCGWELGGRGPRPVDPGGVLSVTYDRR